MRRRRLSSATYLPTYRRQLMHLSRRSGTKAELPRRREERGGASIAKLCSTRSELSDKKALATNERNKRLAAAQKKKKIETRTEALAASLSLYLTSNNVFVGCPKEAFRSFCRRRFGSARKPIFNLHLQDRRRAPLVSSSISLAANSRAASREAHSENNQINL